MSAELERKVADLERLVDILNMSLWLQVQQMHDFDALRDGRCPSCGGDVKILRETRGDEGRPEGVRLEAVA